MKTKNTDTLDKGVNGEKEGNGKYYSIAIVVLLFVFFIGFKYMIRVDNVIKISVKSDAIKDIYLNYSDNLLYAFIALLFSVVGAVFLYNYFDYLKSSDKARYEYKKIKSAAPDVIIVELAEKDKKEQDT